MKITVHVSTIFLCSLERAFKTPMLCDVSKIHTGFGIMPRITHCSDDEQWGREGSSKKVFAAKSLTQKGGFVSIDRILVRQENKYWKIQLDTFQSWMLSFYKFVGEWKTTALEPNKIIVDYTYHLHFSNIMFYPLTWIFAKVFWKMYMRQAIENIRGLADRQEPYKYQ